MIRPCCTEQNPCLQQGRNYDTTLLQLMRQYLDTLFSNPGLYSYAYASPTLKIVALRHCEATIYTLLVIDVHSGQSIAG